MKLRLRPILTLPLLALLAACASGPKLAEMSSQIPTVPSGNGRIWFYRSSSPIGFAVQPAISLNGRKVGDSVPGGFFYVDTPAGPCIVTTATETDYSVKFVLEPAQERFIRTSVAPGLLVGRVMPELVDPPEARGDISTKSYTGTPKPST